MNGKQTLRLSKPKDRATKMWQEPNTTATNTNGLVEFNCIRAENRRRVQIRSISQSVRFNQGARVKSRYNVLQEKSYTVFDKSKILGRKDV